MDRRRGVLGDALTRLIGSMTLGREVAGEPLGREGWLRLEAELPRATSWYQISLDFSAVAEVSRPGHVGLFLHPFTLTLSAGGSRINEWSDSLSRHWGGLASRWTPNRQRGQGAETLRVGGQLSLLDLRTTGREILEIHLRIPWSDHDKREGFEASSRLEVATLRVSTLSRAGRLLRTPGLERVLIGDERPL